MMLVNQSKADQLAGRFEAYMAETLGLESKTSKWPGEKSVPLFLREHYAFYRTRLMGFESLLLIPKGDGEQTPAILVKHMRKVQEKWPEEIVFVNEAVSSLDRKRMIKQKIPFVIPGNQLFLPMLGADLREHFRSIHTARVAFSPSTQVLILDALYNPKNEPDTPTISAKRLSFSTMTMTRAFREIVQAGIGEHRVEGKERRLRWPEKRMELWEQALPHLKSPVKKRTFIGSHLSNGKRVKSGLSALADIRIWPNRKLTRSQ